MHFPYKIVLASKSPRRQYLLREIGIDFEVRTKEVNESFAPFLEEEAIPLYLCKKKAGAYNEEMNAGKLVITADTVVWINDHVLNKPTDAKEAVQMLIRLSGKTHQVFTGVCLSIRNRSVSFWVESKVRFRILTSEEISYYVEHYKPFDKAGAYGAQEGLPEGAHPCSPTEVEFLEKHHLEHLNSPRMAEANLHLKPFPLIENIEGSYFNVMGLPVVELCHELEKFTCLS